MDIRLISSLPPDDEARIAGGLLDAIITLLDQLPIAYSVRLETASGETFDRTRCPDSAFAEVAAPFSSRRWLDGSQQ